MTREAGDRGSGSSPGSVPAGAVADVDAVATTVGEGVYRLDAEGRFLEVNDVVLDLSGYPREELLGEHVSMVLSGEDVEAFEAGIRELLASDDDRVGDLAFELRTAAGEWIACEARFAVEETDGRFVGTAGVVRDVTDRKRELQAVERQRAQFRSELDEALGRVQDAFFSLDADGRFTYVNERAAVLLEREPEDLLGERVLDAFPEAEATSFVEHARAAMESEGPVAFEQFHEPLSAWFEFRLYPGETGVSAYFRDVTEQKRREEVLEQYETVVKAVDDGLYAVDEDYRFTMVNDAYCAMTGYSREELIGSHISTVVDDEAVAEGKRRREALRAGELESGSVEVVMETADGDVIVVDTKYSSISETDDEFRGTVGVVRDVTERKAFEETLKTLHGASRQLHAAETTDDVGRIVIETVTDVLDLTAATLFRYDEDAEMMVPEHRTRGTSYTGQEIPPLPASDESLTGHVFGLGEFRAYDDIRETPYVTDPVTEMRAGLYAPLSDYGMLVVSSTEPGAFDEQTAQLVELLAANVTAAIELHDSERELRSSERRYQTLVENFPNGAVALFDEDLRINAIGGDVYDEVDASIEDAEGMALAERLPSDLYERLEPTLLRALDGEADQVEIHAEGYDFWVHTLPVRDDDGEVFAGMVMAQDVTERKRAEKALKESEHRFRTMMEQSPLSMQIFDPDGNTLTVNPAWERLWQGSSEDVDGYNVLEDEQLEAEGLLPLLRKGFAGEATQIPPTHYDPEEIGKEGRPRWVEALLYPVFDERGDVREVVLVHNDVTERKQAEEELRESEKRARLAIDVAHLGTWHYDPDGNLVHLDERMRAIWGESESAETIPLPDVIERVHPDDRARVTSAIENALDPETDENRYDVDFRIVWPDGQMRWMAANGEARFAGEGADRHPIQFVGTALDVTERRERERDLERYENIVETIWDGVYALDADGRFALVNDAYVELTGYSRGELLGASATIVHGDEVDATAREMNEEVLAGERDAATLEVKLRTADGGTVPIEARFGPYPTDEGYGRTGVVRDVTERLERERELENQRERYRRLVEHAPVPIVSYDADGDLTFGNDAAAELVGAADPDELVGEPAIEFVHPDDRADAAERMTRVLEAGETAPAKETKIVALDGSVKHAIVSAVPVAGGEEPGGQVVVNDVTERKERERALERYEAAVENVGDGVYVTDADRRYTMVNRTYAEMTGYEPEELVGTPMPEVVGEEAAEVATERIDEMLAGEREYAISESHRHAAADETYLENRYTLLPHDGEFRGTTGVVRDVTERKRRERELERYKTAVDTASDVIVSIDERSTVQSVNPAVADVFGYEPDELVGESLTELMPERMTERHRDGVERYLRTDEEQLDWRYTELPGVHEDGHEIPLSISFGEFEHEGERFFTGIIRDNTERKEHERRLEESEQRYRTLAENFPNGAVGLFDHDLRYLLVEGTIFDELEGVSAENQLGLTVEEVFPPETAGDLEPLFRAAIEGETGSVETEFAGRDFQVWATPIRDGDGEIFAGLSFALDVTERKAYERELSKFRTIVERVNDGVYTIDAEGRITMVNEAYAEMVGADRDEIVGMHATELVSREVASQAREIESQLVRDEAETAALSAELKTADGRSVIAEATFATLPFEDDFERVAVVRDVTERVEREEELEQTRDLLERTEAIADVGGWEIDTETSEVFWTEHIFDLLEILYGEEPPLSEALDVYHPDDRPIVEGAVEEALSSGEPFDVEARALTVSDELRWLRVQGVPEVVGDEVVSLRGAAQDVTERVERERELRQFEVLFEESTDVNAVLDSDGTFRYLTPSVARVLGYDHDELVGESAFDYVHPDDHEGATAELAALVEDPAYRPKFEIRFRHRDGSWIDLDVRARNLLDDPDIGGVVAYTRDVTELKERQHELRTRIEQQDVVTELGALALEKHDVDELFDEAVERVTGTLDNELCKLLDLESEGESLALRAGTGFREGLVGETTLGVGDDSIAGRTLQTVEPIVVTDLEAEDPASRPELLTSHGGRSGISVIVGTPEDPWGVLGTYDTRVRKFSRHDVNFVQSVANILGIAIERRSREREIVEQRNQMAALVRLSEVVQKVDRAVIRQSTREEIDELVCERLTETEDYAAAWLGDVNVATETIDPRTAAGVPTDLLEPIPYHSDELGPTVAAVDERRIQIARNPPDSAEPGTGTETETIQGFARERGYRSMAAIPIDFEDVQYGVLTLFAERADAFEGYEAAILEQLGHTIGHAINAIDRKQALVSDSYTELDLRFPDLVEAFSLPSWSDHTITVDGTVPAGGGTVVQYVTVTGVPAESFREVARGLAAVADVRLIGEDDDTEGSEHRFEVTYSDPPITSLLATYGGKIEEVRFDVPDLCVVVAIPQSADVRKIVDAVKTEFPGTRVDAQRTVIREPEPPEEHWRTVEDDLTERQRAALLTAFFAGYFEWSRESTGEEVAETLGVSPSTFHQHLRAAQRKVIASLVANGARA